MVSMGLLAISRGVEWMTEQPGSSLMPLVPYIRYVALAIDPVFWGDVKLSMPQPYI